MKSMTTIRLAGATGKPRTHGAHHWMIGRALRKICSAESYAWALDQVAIVAVTDVKGNIVYGSANTRRTS